VFYTELVQVFREYLHRRKNIYSFSKTTEDLSRQLETLDLDGGRYQHLVQTLMVSDFVKYAKYQASDEERRSSLQSIRESIVSIEQAHVPNPKPQTSTL
jgi:hypothetical protein